MVDHNNSTVNPQSPISDPNDFTQNQSQKQDVEPQDYPDIKEYKNGNIKVLDTYTNLEWLLKKFGAKIRFNMMKRRREINLPWIKIPSEGRENSTLSIITNIAEINGMPTRSIEKHLNYLACENAYHPIVDCIIDNPWNKKPILDDFINTLKTTNPEFDKKLIKIWMVQNMAAAHSQEGFASQGALVLCGPQGVGKTSWIKKLNPINQKSIRTGAIFDPSNKDTLLESNSFWLIELPEVDSIFKKADIGRLKAYITADSDYVRNPHAVRAEELARRSGYIATVNNEHFLVDDTGNRRWWTVTVTEIDYDHNFDMKQVWAEVYHLWINGNPTCLSKELEQELSESNLDYERIDPMKEKVLAFFDWDNSDRQWLTSTQVLEKIGYRNPSQGDATKMGGILKGINKSVPRKIGSNRFHSVPRREIPVSFSSK